MTLPTTAPAAEVWRDPFDDQPESLWAYITDMRAAYHRVSVRRAGNFDGWGALHAQMASDVAASQEVAMRTLGGGGQLGRIGFQEVGNAIVEATSAAVADVENTHNARHAAETCRRLVLEGFEPTSAAAIAELFTDLDHLDQVDPTRRDPDAGYARFAGTLPAHYRQACRDQAAEFAAAAAAADFAGHRADAVVAAYNSDLKAFEAYLLDAAHAVADLAIATVDLRWDTAADLFASADALPDRLDLAVSAVREVLYRVVGPVEWPRLQTYFADITPALAAIR